MEETKKENNSTSALLEFGVDVNPKPKLSMFERPLLLQLTPEIISYTTMINKSEDEEDFVMKHGTNIFKSIWLAAHSVELKNTEIAHDRKEERFTKGRTNKSTPRRGDHFIELKDDTIILCEHMSKSGNWNFSHMDQIMGKGAYLKKAYPNKDIIVLAIAGKITEDFRKDISDMNEEAKQLKQTIRYIPVEIEFHVTKQKDGDRLRVNPTIPTSFKNLFQKFIGTKTNKVNQPVNFEIIYEAIDTEKYTLVKKKNFVFVIIGGIKVYLEPKDDETSIVLYVTDATLKDYPNLINTFKEIAEDTKHATEIGRQKRGLRFNNKIKLNDRRLATTFKLIAETINSTKK